LHKFSILFFKADIAELSKQGESRSGYIGYNFKGKVAFQESPSTRITMCHCQGVPPTSREGAFFKTDRWGSRWHRCFY